MNTIRKLPKVNELVKEKSELQDKLLKLNESGLTPDSPSVKNCNRRN